jgi:chorismate synthase
MTNTFGKIFKITTFGESHGAMMGVVIDGCPANIEITEEDINLTLQKRKPNLNELVSKRKEEDKAKIVSGVFENKTLATPICILIKNNDIKSNSYDKIKNLLRPSHANYTYLKKYKNFDYRGASRASARETVSRVAASAISDKILDLLNVKIFSYVKSIADIEVSIDIENLSFDDIYESRVFCPDKKVSKKMIEKLTRIKKEKDSIGSSVEVVINNVPAGLGDPIFDKLTAKLAHALMSIPAATAIEFKDGIKASLKKGSERNDLFDMKDKKVFTRTNNEGGILAGISTGENIVIRVYFKPIASIEKPQNTIDIYGNKKVLKFSNNLRSDITAAIRAVSIVKAMCSLVLVDCYLIQNAYENLNFTNKQNDLKNTIFNK